MYYLQNYVLDHAPPESISYSEMIHLLEPTHNDNFVALLTEHYPTWREARAELNELPLGAEEWDWDQWKRLNENIYLESFDSLSHGDFTAVIKAKDIKDLKLIETRVRSFKAKNININFDENNISMTIMGVNLW